MTREVKGRNLTRERIAHLAARIMAEDGIDDFALAKRKAARQAGAESARNLPDNLEIEQALRAYLDLYQHDEHAELLVRLRRQAAGLMRELARFSPHLTGSVLSGTAGRWSDINLQLFCDSVKDVEMFLLSSGRPYRSGEARFHLNQGWRTFPQFIVDCDGTPATLTVLSTDDLRTPLRATEGGRTIERAGLAWLEERLAES